MPDNIVSISIKANTQDIAPALSGAADSVAGFTNQVKSGAGDLNVFKDALREMLSQGAANRQSFQDISGSLREVSGNFKKAKVSAAALNTELGKATHRAEMSELASSIKEGVENPLIAARSAAEGLLLELGKVGAAGIGFLALGAAALEAAHHVGEVALEARNLSVELGVAVETAQVWQRRSCANVLVAVPI